MRNGNEVPGGSRSEGERAVIGRREIDFERSGGGCASDDGVDERSIAQDSASVEDEQRKYGTRRQPWRWKAGDIPSFVI
jgi:hypothetical protein